MRLRGLVLILPGGASPGGSLPEIPEILDDPEIPEIPDPPDILETPAIPEIPEIPDVPRHDLRRFRVNFRVDFRRFSRLYRASESTRCAKRFFQRFSSIFRLLAKCGNPLKYRACRSKSRFGTSRSESTHSREVASKNNENQIQN